MIETSDAFVRKKKRQPGLSKRVAERSQKFHNWYRHHEETMLPAFAAALEFMDQPM